MYRDMSGDEIAALAAEGALLADLHGIWRDRNFRRSSNGGCLTLSRRPARRGLKCRL